MLTFAAASPTPGFIDSLLGLFGRLHPVVVHLPIGLLVVAAMCELCAALTGKQTRSRTAMSCLLIGAPMAMVAAACGWFNAWEHGTEGGDALQVWLHRWLGIVAAVTAMVLVVAARFARRTAEGSATGRIPAVLVAYRVGLIGCAVVVAATGYFGATLTHGQNYLALGMPSGIHATAEAETERVDADEATAKSAIHASGTPAQDVATRAVSDQSLQGLLFASTPEEHFAARRRARLDLLPPAPPIPAGISGGENPVDLFLARSWGVDVQAMPPACDDATFARRAYLDLIGVIPTVAELRAFLGDTRAGRRDRLIDTLLARNEDYADHWTPFWEDALVSSPVTTNGGMATHGNYTEWIHKAFVANKPFDQFAAELLDPTLPGHKPAERGYDNGTPRRVHYVLNQSHTDTLQTAAGVAQVFMGTAMKCASCHNHFENPEWPQKRFTAFAGLFADHDLELIRCEKRSGEYLAAHFPFEIPGAPADPPKDETQRLHYAAQLLVDPLNPRFAKTIVNRLWKRYFGLGFIEPADDFREDHPPSEPELLAWLSDDFMRHGYDLKHTIRLILTSRAYQLRYNPALEDHFDTSKPDQPRWFKSPQLRRLTAEQLMDSLTVATTQKLDPSQRQYKRLASTNLSRALGKPAIRNDVSTGRSDQTAVLQGLELLNGEEFQAITRSGVLAVDVLDAKSANAAAQLMFAAILSREANDQEESILAAIPQFATPASRRRSAPKEIVWLDDEIPAGVRPTDSWVWTEPNQISPVSGRRAHFSRTSKDDAQAQHFFLGANPPLAIGGYDAFFVDVYLDAKKLPKEVMIQFNAADGMDGGWGHRAYWGTDQINFGVSGTASRKRIGSLPETGKWVRLEFPAAAVGLGDSYKSVVGVSFDQAGGTVYFDRVGVVHRDVDGDIQPIQDLLWGLFSSPEFQYIK